MSHLRASYEELPVEKAYRKLPSGMKAPVLFVMDLPAMVKRYEDAGYVVIGMVEASYSLSPFSALSDLAAEKGASVVLANYIYTGTYKTESLVPVLDTVTTYHQGTISNNSALSPYPSYSYSGSSTSFRTRLQPVTSYASKYQQCYVFLAPTRAAQN